MAQQKLVTKTGVRTIVGKTNSKLKEIKKMTKLSIAESERANILRMVGGREEQMETKFNFPHSIQAMKEIKESALCLGPNYTVVQEMCKGFYNAILEADKADVNSWLIKIVLMIGIINCSEDQAVLVSDALVKANVKSSAGALCAAFLQDSLERDLKRKNLTE